MFDSGNVLFGLTLTVASLATIYVLFGPNLNQPNSLLNNNKKRRKKEIQINGLENTGSNCYVNVIVQALCSSDSFIDWLRESLIQQELFSPSLIDRKQQSAIRFIHYLFSIIFRNNLFYRSITSSSDQPNRTKFCAEKTLTFQLLKLLQEVNGKGNLGITLNSSKLLEILYNFNFESRNEQQDAHELFNFLTSSLENEILHTLSTTDSLNAIQTNAIQNGIQNGIHNGIRNEIQTSNGLQGTNEKLSLNNEAIRIDGDLNRLSSNELKLNEDVRLNEQQQLNKTKEERMFNISKELNNEYETIKRSLNLKRNLPTKGLLGHQMFCLKCENKFTIQFESFHCISLPLVSKHPNEPITLKDCLNAFVSNEILKDVVCENCQKLEQTDDQQRNKENTENEKKDNSNCNQQHNSSIKKSTFVKRLTFAKLPQLLVIHFQRLVCLPNGRPIKKEDRIKFPNILIMDEFELHAIQQKNSLNVLSALNLSKNLNMLNFSNKSNDLNASTDTSNALNNSNILNNLNGSNCSAKSNAESSKLFNNQANESQLLNGSIKEGSIEEASMEEGSMEEGSMESNIIVNNDNHLNNANLSNDNDISQIISSSIKQQDTSPTIASSSNSVSNDKTEECSTLTPLKTTDGNSTKDSSEDSNFISHSQLNNTNTTNKTSPVDSRIKIETKATDEYSNKELSNKNLSNSIKSNSDLIFTSSKKDVKYKYRLNACIVHFGSTHSGHYISHRRKSLSSSNSVSNELNSTSDWYFASDNIIRNSSLDDALRSNAYMLFYERIK